MTHQPAPDRETDPTLAVAERQLVLLGELAEISMMAARAFGSSAVAAAAAEQRILAEEWYTPEVGRARACGAKDAAESLQKVSRAVRLTMKLEMAVAEIVRDIRAGIVTHSHTGEDARGPVETLLSYNQSAGVLARSCSGENVRDRDRRDLDAEPLVEFDRPDSLPGAPFRATVDGLCANLGAKVDWKTWTIRPPDLDRDALPPRSLGRSETRPPGINPSPLPTR